MTERISKPLPTLPTAINTYRDQNQNGTKIDFASDIPILTANTATPLSPPKANLPSPPHTTITYKTAYKYSSEPTKFNHIPRTTAVADRGIHDVLTMYTNIAYGCIMATIPLFYSANHGNLLPITISLVIFCAVIFLSLGIQFFGEENIWHPNIAAFTLKLAVLSAITFLLIAVGERDEGDLGYRWSRLVVVSCVTWTIIIALTFMITIIRDVRRKPGEGATGVSMSPEHAV
ncbi:hypothetical protein M422DRAFT_259790 [Sphaerobolus stellatus SS14]|uniref:Uncharacterized protein n=1 Tax=Sphaerobolus stellatus (strain SS14) TaxID=990650 RepID=A0A0C9VJ93_SPHS4|nr:hypothetical protein M422DRAFT_259790 [Sphaerobolus stellatus SS14]